MTYIKIDTESDNLRFDKFLRKHLQNAALSFIFKLIREGRAKVNDKKVKQDYRLRDGDVISFGISDDDYKRFRLAKEKAIKSRKTFDVLYEDEDILIANKPPFLASQPGTGVERNNLVNQIKSYLKNSKTKPALANRLDRGTSGLVVVGKNRRAILALHDLFKKRQVKKYYLTLVKGILNKKEGTLTSYLKRTTEKFQHKMLVLRRKEEGTVTAEMSYRVLEESKDYSLLEVRIATGKMHQIRAQLASIGHPVVGDPVYGDKKTNEQFRKVLRRQFLHAYKIRFAHPSANKQIEVTTDLPADLQQTLKLIDLAINPALFNVDSLWDSVRNNT